MQWTVTRADSGRWWGTGRPIMLQSTGSQRVRHDWATDQQHMTFPVAQLVRTCLPVQETKRCGFDPWVRKIPWSRNGNPLQCSCLKNPMDRRAWQTAVHGVAKSQTCYIHMCVYIYIYIYIYIFIYLSPYALFSVSKIWLRISVIWRNKSTNKIIVWVLASISEEREPRLWWVC